MANPAAQGLKALIRPDDWIVYQGKRYVVVSATQAGEDVCIETKAGVQIKVFVQDVADLIYSRAEDRASEIALNLRVQEALLMSQIQIHHAALGEAAQESESGKVSVELICALLEVRRRMRTRDQRPSEALDIRLEGT